MGHRATIGNHSGQSRNPAAAEVFPCSDLKGGILDVNRKKL